MEEGDAWSQEDNSYLSAQDLCTLSEDMSFKAEVLARRPTVFVRPDDRTDPRRFAYAHADERGISYLGFITRYGSHATKTPPEHEEPRLEINIESREAKLLRNISPDEFLRAYQRVRDVPSAIQYLTAKYPARRFSPDSVVTVYHITYV